MNDGTVLELITVKELATRLNVCRPTADKIGRENGAKYKFGRTARYDWSKIIKSRAPSKDGKD